MVGAVVEVFYPLHRLSMMTPYCRFLTTEALVQSVLPFGFLSGQLDRYGIRFSKRCQQEDSFHIDECDGNLSP